MQSRVLTKDEFRERLLADLAKRQQERKYRAFKRRTDYYAYMDDRARKRRGLPAIYQRQRRHLGRDKL